MIAFGTLLLGLVFGPVPVRVVVGPQVACVEYRLDGVAIGSVSGEPWVLICNLGNGPHPHELTVIARDGEGRELGRAQQWINLFRPNAEAQLLLERESAGNRVMAVRLVWDSVKFASPKAVSVTLDGKAIPVANPERFELPIHDPKQAHLLSAEIQFPDDLSTRVDAVFGGDVADRAQAELTAVPVVQKDEKSNLPSASDLQGWFAAGDEPLRVVATERGVAEVVLVLDQAIKSSEFLRRFGAPTWANLLTLPRAKEGDDRLFLQFTVPQTGISRDGREYSLMPMTTPYALNTKRFFYFLTSFTFPAGDPAGQRLADAVAVAGEYAAGRNHRRAVVVVIDDMRIDASVFGPQTVRRYLEELRVPLFVWWLTKRRGPTITMWGETEDISNGRRLDDAAVKLQKSLNAQRIVWVDGAHLPQTIRLTPKARGIRLAS